MIFNIKIHMDNAAFDDYPATELARILNDLAERVKDGETPPMSLRDLNGNKVGTVFETA